MAIRVDTEGETMALFALANLDGTSEMVYVEPATMSRLVMMSA